MSDVSQGQGWWQASDGRWYPPQSPESISPTEPPRSTVFHPHYEAEVNKGSINMRYFTGTLNKRWNDGWRLDKLFEQDGNTIMVWERRS
jgi:hypothetical protein